MNEISLTLGSERHLAATLTLPGGQQQPEVAVILMNAGVIHRMGPHRFNVKLARALAEANVPSLRLDLSGQGDSRAPTKPIEQRQQVVLDLKAAMDHVARICSVERFVIAGICSGAVNGLATALEDERVVGLWLLDGPVFPTRKTHRVRYVHQLRSRPFGTLWSWGLRAARSPLAVFKAVSAKPSAGNQQFTHAAFASALQTLVDRGTAINVVYTGSMYWSYNHTTQFADAFAGHAFLDKVRCDFVTHVDHTASTRAAQQHLIGMLLNWLREASLSPVRLREHEAEPADA